MDNGARLPLYAGTRLGEGTVTQGLRGRVGISIGKAAAPARRWDVEGSLLGKGPFSLERKSFSDGAGLGETQFPPIPQPEESMRRG